MNSRTFATEQGKDWMANERYSGPKSPLTGLYFLVDDDRNPVVILLDGVLCMPVFTGPQPIADAERWFSIARSRVLQIADGNRFYDVFHHDFPIVLDPRIVEGQCLYDAVQVDPDPKEVS